MSVRTSGSSSLISWLLIAIYVGSANAQNTLIVKNDTNGFMQLWVWKEQNSRWDHPPMGITRGQEKYLDTATRGKYYLVARDDAQRDFHMGWFDFHDLKAPKLELLLNKVYETDFGGKQKSQNVFGWRILDV